MHVGEDFISVVFIYLCRDIAYIYIVYELRGGPACSSFRKNTATKTCQYIYGDTGEYSTAKQMPAPHPFLQAEVAALQPPDRF